MTDTSAQRHWIDRLITHDTTSHLSNLSLISDVEGWLSSHNIPHWRAPDDDQTKTNLYALIGPNEAGGVVLSGHTDVVPVAGQAWDSDPFKVVERDQKLFGRGTSDMKSFLAIALSLVPEMVAAPLKKPIILALSYDEEVGCIGAPRMIERIVRDLPTPQAVIVGEPTMMKVIDGHKGIASFRTTVTGFTTHSSQTDRGVSAVEGAARLIAWISDKRADYKSKSMADKIPGSAPSGFDPDYSTMTVNVVRGGTQLNIMAGEASFEWDMRLIPDDDQHAILSSFHEFSASLEQQMRTVADQCRIVTEQMTNAPALAPRPDNPAADLAKALTGHNNTEVVSYAAEAGQFQQAGLSTVICGPGSIDQAHQANEFIALNQVAAGTQFQQKLIQRLSH